MIEIKAPNEKKVPYSYTKIFLAGSIEMGKAAKWQDKVINCLEDISKIVIYNPRRNRWNSKLEQSINNKVFRKQVEWEQEHLENSHIRFFYFDPKTKSPITLLELGQATTVAWMQPVIVVCPEGYWRKGNVDIVCSRANVRVYNSLGEGVEALRNAVIERI